MSNFEGMSDMMQKAIAFIWAEAEMLDRKDYNNWEELWLDEGHYVVPIDRDTEDFASTLNYVYDDKRMRRMRIVRLTSGNSMSAVDAATTVRTISRFTKKSETADTIEVKSAQVVVAYKRGTNDLFAADVTHRIRFVNGEPRLEQKVVRLINSEDSLNAIGFLL